MTKINTLNQGTLGLPCTPCNWVGEPKYADYLEILVTCGGGMGGKSWYEYAKEAKTDLSALDDKILYFTDINGKEIFLNARYIVKAQVVRIMTVKYNSRNRDCHPGMNTERWIVEGDVELKDAFESRLDLTRGQ